MKRHVWMISFRWPMRINAIYYFAIFVLRKELDAKEKVDPQRSMRRIHRFHHFATKTFPYKPTFVRQDMHSQTSIYSLHAFIHNILFAFEDLKGISTIQLPLFHRR